MKKLANKNSSYQKILDHPDREEIINKLAIGIEPEEIAEWLKTKYSDVSSKLVIAKKPLSEFKDQYLDFYNTVYQDLNKVKINMQAQEDELKALVIQNPTYQNILEKTANEELDVRQIVRRLCTAIETRFSQIFDTIMTNPEVIEYKLDRTLIEYTQVLGDLLEKGHKFTEVPVNTNVQQNITINMVDQHADLVISTIKEVLSNMDLQASLYFMELYNEKISKLKAPTEEKLLPSDVKLAEAKVLAENINKKIN